MAVEARHLNLFHPQLIAPNRDLFVNHHPPMEFGGGDHNVNVYNNNNNNSQIGYGGVPLLSGTTTAETLHLPTYNSVIVDSVSPKTAAAAVAAAAMKSDSGLTYNHNLPLPRKRSRECMNGMNPFVSYPCPPSITPPPPPSKSCGSFSFLGEDISLQIHHQQLEIDRLISQHLEKVRSEVEEKRKRQARRIMEAIEVGVMKRLKAKEEEIEKIGKLNWALEERVKSLSIENQLWRDMAQTNEAAVNALRTNLEQVLCDQVKEDHRKEEEEEMEDAESSCGSNDLVEEEEEVQEVGTAGEWRMVVKNEKEEEKGGSRRRRRRECRNCGKEESSVLLLPCRHLCLCTVCGSTVHICPICKSTKNASVHVNML